MSKNISKNFNSLGLNNAGIRTRGKGVIEDSTEYGEFVATFDAWLTPEEQKRRAKHLENLDK